MEPLTRTQPGRASGMWSRTPATGQRTFFGHPIGLAYLCFTEAWERFSFSGMQTMLVLYMVGALLKPGHIEHVEGMVTFRHVLGVVYGPLQGQPLSSVIFGLYTGLVFFTPVFGGLLGDRVFGQRRVVIAGAVLMAIGHFLMAFEASFLLALLLLIIGSGCLKGNISTQVSSLYGSDAEDSRRASGFQIFSAGINSGIILAPLVCGTLGEVYGWDYGFGAAGVGMLVGLLIYLAGQRHLPPDQMVTAREKMPVAPLDRRLLEVLAGVFILTTCFLILGGQLGNVYGLWLHSSVDRKCFGIIIPVTWFQSLTPLFTVCITPLVLRMWRHQASSSREPGLMTKMCVGLFIGSGALLWLAILAYFAGPFQPVFWMLLIPTHILICISYLLVWPVGLALFSSVAPTGAKGMFIGIFFLSSFVASNIVGWTGAFYQTMPAASFWFMQAAIGSCGGLLALIFRGRWSRLMLSANDER